MKEFTEDQYLNCEQYEDKSGLNNQQSIDKTFIHKNQNKTLLSGLHLYTHCLSTQTCKQFKMAKTANNQMQKHCK